MALTLSGTLTKILTGLGIDLAAAESALTAIRTEFPDLASQAAMFAQWLEGQVADAAKEIPATLKALAVDVVAGVSGVDPEAWKGSF